MRMATDSASLWTRPHRLLLIPLVLALCSVTHGCAGLSALGQGHSSLSSVFWNRPTRTVELPAYDDYAAAATASHPNLARELAVVRKDSRPKPSDPLDNPTRNELLARADELQEKTQNRSSGRSARSSNERTADSSIRVTLGQPESLQTISDSHSSNESLLASAPATNWQRSEADGRFQAPIVEDVAASAALRRRALSPEVEVDPQAVPPPSQARGASPAPRTRASSDEDKLHSLLAAAKARLDALSSYQVSMTRVERVGGQLQTEDDVLLSVRRQPRAVRLEWTSGPSKGREVIYSKAVNDRTMYVNLANSALPMPRMSIPVDSPLAMRNSRHPITEAGFDTILDDLLEHVKPGSVDSTRKSQVVYKGLESPRGLGEPCHLLERTTPGGETWQVYLQTKSLMPVVVTASQTQSGELIERYSYRNLQLNPVELASVEAFDPDKRWGESKTWLSRLARAAGSPKEASSESSTTR